MKTKIKIISSALCYIVLLSFASCVKGDKGDMGPIGNDGKNGVANISTTSFVVGNWSIPNGNVCFSQLTVPAITSSVLSNGAVQVFMSGDGGATYAALPLITVQNYSMQFEISYNQVTLYWVYSGSGTMVNPYFYFGGTMLFKVVVIPPAIIKQHPNIDLNNYSEVKATFNLKD